MLKTDFLSASDGSLLPIEHFSDCMFILFFTKNKSKKCAQMLGILQELRLENRYSNIVFVQVSMDNHIDDWSACPKNENWLEFPFFPIENRRNLFKQFNVECLPFMVVLIKDQEPYKVSKNIFKDLYNNKSNSLTNELTRYQEHYGTCEIDDFILI